MELVRTQRTSRRESRPRAISGMACMTEARFGFHDLSWRAHRIIQHHRPQRESRAIQTTMNGHPEAEQHCDDAHHKCPGVLVEQIDQLFSLRLNVANHKAVFRKPLVVLTRCWVRRVQPIKSRWGQNQLRLNARTLPAPYIVWLLGFGVLWVAARLPSAVIRVYAVNSI
jgi:hypothetical protein